MSGAFAPSLSSAMAISTIACAHVSAHESGSKIRPMMHRGLLALSLGALFIGLAPSMKAALAGDAEGGKEVLEQCSVCHNADSEEKKMGPGLKGLFKKDKMKNGKKPTEENVKAVINAGGNGMPGYQDLLSDEERENLLAYLKTL